MTRYSLLLVAACSVVGASCTEKPAHNANWYYYWESDNVIEGLDRFGSPASRWDWDVQAANSGVYGASHGPSNGYVLTDLCITLPVSVPIPVYHRLSHREVRIGATTQFALQQAATTMAHEKEHIATWQHLHSGGQVDTDEDGLADSREGSPWDLVVGYKDTYDLEHSVDPHYASYGDDEFLARIGEVAGLSSAHLDQDWSQGGAQWRR